MIRSSIKSARQSRRCNGREAKPVYVFACGVVTLPIHRLLENQAFDPEDIRSIVAAFEDALRELCLTDRSSPAVEIVAQRTIDYAQRGERDPIKLRDLVLQSFNGCREVAPTSEQHRGPR